MSVPLGSSLQVGRKGRRRAGARTLHRSHTSAQRRTDRERCMAVHSGCRCSRGPVRNWRLVSTRRPRARGIHQRCQRAGTQAGTRSRPPRCTPRGIGRTCTRKGPGSRRLRRARQARRVTRIPRLLPGPAQAKRNRQTTRNERTPTRWTFDSQPDAPPSLVAKSTQVASPGATPRSGRSRWRPPRASRPASAA